MKALNSLCHLLVKDLLGLREVRRLRIRAGWVGINKFLYSYNWLTRIVGSFITLIFRCFLEFYISWWQYLEATSGLWSFTWEVSR